MSRPQRSSQRGRHAGRIVRARYSLLSDLGLDFSWPVTGLTLLVLAFGFGPLLLIALFDIQGLGRNVLVAAGPVFVCLAFAIMTYFYGMRHAAEMGMTRLRVWSLVGLFAVLGVLAGWGLFMSV